jgi:hypothetical protein
MNKFINTRKFVKQMSKRDCKRRPDCQKILESEQLWALNKEEFYAEEELRFVEENSFYNPFV